jgi:hypothetical protein
MSSVSWIVEDSTFESRCLKVLIVTFLWLVIWGRRSNGEKFPFDKQTIEKMDPDSVRLIEVLEVETVLSTKCSYKLGEAWWIHTDEIHCSTAASSNQ